MFQKIGIVGFGLIGKAVFKLFQGKKVDLYIYDKDTNKYINTNQNEYYQYSFLNEPVKETLNDCDFIFICVPTPHNNYEGLDMSKIEEVVKTFVPKKSFVSCSTLQPGTADKLSKEYNKKIIIQPEYFGETINHPLVNLSSQPFLILGGENDNVNELIKVYKKVYNANIKIRKVTCLEAEVIKLSENRAVAYKVLQCQELYDVCIKAGVDYETIRQAVYNDDPRFNLWFTFIYEESRGLTSSCLPKDLYGWYAWAKENGIEPEVTKKLLEYNNKLIVNNKGSNNNF